jgi:hypothetical protein
MPRIRCHSKPRRTASPSAVPWSALVNRGNSARLAGERMPAFDKTEDFWNRAARD